MSEVIAQLRSGFSISPWKCHLLLGRGFEFKVQTDATALYIGASRFLLKLLRYLLNIKRETPRRKAMASKSEFVTVSVNRLFSGAV
jgi:hypothetical protein